MLSMNDIAAFFGGTIPDWVYILGGIVLVVVLIGSIAGSSGSDNSSGYKKGDIKIGRNINGTYYAYDSRYETVLYTAPTKQEVAQWVAMQVR